MIELEKFIYFLNIIRFKVLFRVKRFIYCAHNKNHNDEAIDDHKNDNDDAHSAEASISLFISYCRATAAF